MKKALIVLLVLALLLTGFLFHKGVHHVFHLTEALEEWLDADDADQFLSVDIRTPGTEPRQISLTADTFWTESDNCRLFGLSDGGMTVWTDGTNLYMDTGKSYALPRYNVPKEKKRKMVMGLLLYGRVTKTDDAYHLSMKTDDLELNIDLTVKQMVQNMNIHAVLPDGTAVTASMNPKETSVHFIPREITDAIARARTEPPVPLLEPLEVLLPALEDPLPLHGDLTLGVSCGILDLQETVGFSMNRQTIELERNGSIVCVDLPASFSGADPAVLALLFLRNGSFTLDGSCAQFEIILPADTTAGLCEALVPQAESLSIVFSDSHATVTIVDKKLHAVSLTADGEVPFLITTIPVNFQAELMIR